MGNVDKFDSDIESTPMQSILTEVPGYGIVGVLFYPGERRIVCNDQKISFTEEEWEAFRPHLEWLCK